MKENVLVCKNYTLKYSGVMNGELGQQFTLKWLGGREAKVFVLYLQVFCKFEIISK